MSAQADTAKAFHRLHAGPDLLLLVNAWDAGSARLFESLGAKAIATTSAGVAWANGYPDGDVLPLDHLVATVSAIARAIGVPLTVDMEGGYAEEPAVGEAVGRVIDAGAVGINIEDGSDAPDLLCAKIERIREASGKRGIDLFVNARTDVYLRGLVPETSRVEETLARAKRYRDAGASGIFVPGLVDPDGIRAVSSGIDLPLNVMARPNLPAGAELVQFGVRRLSAGSGIAEAVFGRAAELAEEFLKTGISAPLSKGAMLYGAINGLMTGR